MSHGNKLGQANAIMNMNVMSALVSHRAFPGRVALAGRVVMTHEQPRLGRQ